MRYIYLLLIFLVGINNVFSQGTSCSTAPTLTTNTTETCANFTVTSTTGSAAGCSGSGYGGSGYVSYFKVCTDANANCIKLDFTAGTITGTAEIALYSTCTAGAISGYVANSISCEASLNATWSTTGITLAANTCYYVRVWTKNQGTFSICSKKITPPANDACSGAFTLSETPIHSDNYCYTKNATDPAVGTFCAGSIENTAWFQFTPLCNSSSVTINIDNIQCAGGAGGFQIGYYTGSCGSLVQAAPCVCTGAAQGPGSCLDQSTGSVSTTVTLPANSAGQPIHVIIDGNAGSQCDFDIYALGITPTITPPTTICAGQSTTITATGGGTYLWSPGGATTASITVSPTSTTTYSCTVTPSTGCSKLVTSQVTVNALPAAPSVTGGSVCGSGTVALSAAGCGGTGTLYWYTVSTGGTSIATGTSFTTPTISTTTTYYVSCTLNGCESPRTPVAATVVSTATPPTTVGGTRCGTGTVALSASGCGGGTLSWYTASTGGSLVGTGPNYTTASISTTTTYYVSCTLGGCTSTRSPVVATITSAPTAPTTVPGSVCGSGTVALSAAGCSTGTLNWYTASTGGTAFTTGANYTTASISTTTTYYVSCALTGCESPRTSVVATVIPLPSPPSVNSGSVCGSGTVALSAAGCSTGTLNWYDGSTGGTAITTGTNYTTPSISTTTTYYVSCTIGGCESNRTPVTATVNPLPTAPTTTGAGRCSTGTVNLSATGCAVGTLNWYTASSGGVSLNTGASYTTPSLSTTTTFYVSCTDANSCISTRTPVIATINPLPTAPTTTPGSVCGTGTVNLTAIGCSGGTLNWYSSSTGGSILGTGASFTTPSISATTTYYVSCTDVNGCVSTRTSDVATVNTLPTAPATTGGTVCGSGTVDLSATGCGGGTINWYASSSGGVSLGTGTFFTTPSISSTTTYYVSCTDANLCVSTRNPVVATVITPPSAPTITPGERCGAGTVSLSAVGCLGGTLNWYSVSSGGTSIGTGSPFTTPSISATTTYYVSCTISGCEGPRTAVAATINANPTATISGTDVVCFGQANGTATVVPAGGTPTYTYAWSPSGGTGATATGLTPNTYSATVTDSKGCVVTITQNIAQPAALTQSGSITNVLCNGASTGAVNVTTAGGNSPYTYSWSNGTLTEDLSGVSGGSYTLLITDNKGCTSSAPYVITTPTPINATSNITNAGCSGSLTGAVDITVSGGSGTYSYSWSNGTTTQDISGVAAGSYTVVVTDGNSCAQTFSYTVSQPGGLTGTVNSTNITCNGAANGTASISASGGTGTLSYSWSNGSTSASLTGLSAGTYNIVVTDGNNCTFSSNAVITEPAVLNASIAPTNVLCNGAATGAAGLTVTGGVSPYTYTWSNGSYTEDLSGLIAGTYNVTVKDQSNCTTATSVTLTQPPAMNLVTSSDSSNCGANNGSATVVASGGSSPYTYSWSAGSNADAQTGLGAGSYSVTVTDNNGCSQTVSVSVSSKLSPTASIFSSQNVSCFGGTNGSATIDVTGGTSPYTYTWSPSGGNGASASGLSAGTYTVDVVDNDGCATSIVVNITQPTALTAVLNTQTNITCIGGTNGSATVSVSGGTSPYSYSWSPSGGSTASASGLSAGPYVANITDNLGCSTTVNVTITEPLPINVTPTPINVLCNGGTNGGATVLITGGTLPYTTFSWNNGSTSQNLTNVAAGSYTLTVTDFNGCTGTGNVTVSEPALPLTATTSATDASCGAADGTAVVNASGGTSPYSYNWTSGGQSTSNINGLTAGTYNVIVTDDNGCTYNTSATVSNTAAPLISVTSTSDVNCFGGNDGSATVNATGGTGAITYSWIPGGYTNATESSLSAGAYNVVATDDLGCTVNTTVVINEPILLTASVSAQSNPTCFGGADGIAAVTQNGGTAPYTYSWSNGGTASSLTGLIAGTYTIQVTDDNGCTANTSVTLTQPTQLVATVSSTTNVSCNGGNDGTASISVSGGTSPYSYSWTPSGDNTSSATGLSFGSYTIYVTDNASCTTNVTLSITQPPALTVTGTTSNALCNGGATGGVDITSVGGTSPYSFSWSTGALTEDISSVSSGSYAVVVTDDNNCSVTQNFTVNDASLLAIVLDTVINANCGQADGSASVIASGGTAPLTYSWSNNQTSQNATNLTSGSYTAFVTDSNLCTASVIATIADLPGGTVSVSGTDPSCVGVCNGTATAVMSGGTAPFTYSWSGGGGTSTVSGLCDGTQTVTVTDNVGCIATGNVSLTYGPPVIASASTNNVLCNGGSSGSVTSTVSGGTSPYTYAWSNGTSNANLSGVVVGTYSFTVTDVNGCTANASAIVSEPSILTLTLSGQNISCAGGSDGQISSTVNGGTSPYTYEWTPSLGTGNTLTNVPSGAYSLTITDFNGCVVSDNIALTQPTPLSLSFSTVNSNCATPDGSVTTTISGGTTPYSFSWSNSSITQDLTGVSTGTYTLTVTDNKGCVIANSATVGQNSGGSASISASTNPLCAGSANGSMAVSVSGGFSPYTYSWSNGQTSDNISGLIAGTYTVSVTDDKGCIYNTIGTLSDPPALATSTTKVENTCFNDCIGQANVQVTGGTGSYTYLWNDPLAQTNANAINLCAGTFIVNVSDVNNCSITDTVVVNQPSELTGSTVTTEAGCTVANGTATVSANGGTLPYTYSWDNGQTSANATNLASGGYSVTVTDNNGCTLVVAATVNTATGPVPSIVNVKNVKCFGDSTGEAEVVVAGGLSPYAYTWSAGQVTPVVADLSQGVHLIEVTDANGCVGSASVTITEPSILQLNIGSTDPKCTNACDASATANVVGGTLPYSYLWDDLNLQNAQTAVNLCAGTYNLMVTDSNGCQVSGIVILNNPPSMSLNITSQSTKCVGSCDGQLIVDATFATAPLTYLWNDASAQVSQTAVNLCAGTYTVQVTDFNGCIQTATGVVLPPDTLKIFTALIQDASCYGYCDGLAQVYNTGGSAPYTYEWNDPASQTSDMANNLCAGMFNVTATDANGCSVSANVTIGQPQILLANVVKQNVKCFGACDGTASVTVNGGTSPYNYLWSPSFQTTSSVTGLCAGVHNVTVTDSLGCIVVSGANITEPAELIVDVTNVQDANCNQQNGSACVAVAGGTGAISYNWPNNISNATCASGIGAGNYLVLVTDASGCSDSTIVSVGNINGPNVSILSYTNASCYGYQDGTATATISGGVSPYSVVWNDPSNTPSSNVTGLPAGVWGITVTDNAGCIDAANVTILEPTPMLISAQNLTQATCIGFCDGTASALANGGTSPYSYTWNPATNIQTGLNAIDLCVGPNTLIVSDNNSCKDTVVFNITQPSNLSLNAQVFNVKCNGQSNGSIVLIGDGGNAPYSYSWNPSVSSNAQATNLSAGTYEAFIIDNNNCTYSQTYTVSEPAVISLTTSSLSSSCNISNGVAIVSATGGTPGYSYLWNPTGQQNDTAFNLLQGQYNIAVRDIYNCSSSATVTVGNIPKPVIETFTSHASCYGDSSGQSLAVVNSGGIPPYSFLWTPTGQTTSNATGLTAGTYTVQVKDSTGCTVNGFSIVNQPGPFLLNISPDLTLCTGQSGQVYAVASGGTPGYAYSWTPNGGNTNNVTVNPSASTIYSITAFDNHGCMVGPKAIQVTVRAPIVAVISGPDSICLGATSNLASNVTGGLGTYVYSWIPNSEPTSGIVVNPNQSGIYNYSVIVNDGCSLADTAFATLVVNPKPSLLFVSDIYEGCVPLTINFAASNSLPGAIVWNFGDNNSGNGNTPIHTYNQSGEFSVSAIVTTPEGCSDSVTNVNYINAFPLPVADFSFSPNEELDVFNSEVTFTDNSTIPNTWIWNFGDSLNNPVGYTSVDQNPVHMYNDTGNYCIKLLVTSDKGCTDTTLKCLYIKPSVAIYIPNAFTPNGDAINEGFKPVHVGIVEDDYKFMIFDRWGNLIFETKNRYDSWDGTLGGQPCQIDTYVYRLQCKDIFANPHNYTGQVHLVR